ncbi:MAG: TlpA family protein disulfide reductase [Chloroflexota bacterium]|nr:TlpA family protein disulfide reductase [Chloroflexota bacterium]
MDEQQVELRRSQSWSQRPLIGPFSARQVAAVVATLVVSGFLLVALTTPLAGAPNDDSPPRPGSGFVAVGPTVEGLRIGDRAPELAGEIGGVKIQLRDLEGNVIRLSALRGRPVWINFWATWCPPCQEETPVLRDVYQKYRDDGLELVAVSVQETTVDDVREYVRRYGLEYTVGFDATSAVFQTYRAFGLPTQLFVDRDGIIRDIVLGPVTRAEAESIIAPLVE